MTDKLLYALFGVTIGFLLCLYVAEKSLPKANISSPHLGQIVETTTTVVQKLDSLKLVLARVRRERIQIVTKVETDTVYGQTGFVPDDYFIETAYADTTIENYGDFYMSYSFPPLDRFRLSFFPSIPTQLVTTHSVLIPTEPSNAWYKSRWISFFAGTVLASTAFILAN